ncbi:MAG TPA: hypothetical protein DCS93_41360 [Microscillaceae bacterium]|nr:hypothetical protein [Microscillaceae bacterium]
MSKWPSFRDLIIQRNNTLSRYPFAMLSAALGAVVLVVAIQQQTDLRTHINTHGQSLMALTLGVLIFLIVDLYAERNQVAASRKLVFEMLAFAVVITYYLLLPKELTYKNYLRFILFFVTGLLMISYIPFVKSLAGEVNAFWQFNLAITLRFITSLLYSSLLFGGIALALFATDYLFNLQIVSPKLYIQLAIFVFGIANALFFFSGIPKNVDSLETKEDYPTILHFFVELVLIPLVFIYLSILYIYGVVILVRMELPKGLVTYLVIIFAGIGMITFLIVYPIRQQKNSSNPKKTRRLQRYHRNFSLSLFPLLALLFWGVGKRIQDYGFTELRYLILVLAIWLTGIHLYLLISKAKNIKFTTISLSIVCLLSSFGPWGVFMTSVRSQTHRFTQIMQEHQLLKQGVITPNPQATKLSPKDQQNLQSILTFFIKRNNLDHLQPLFTNNLDSLIKKSDSEEQKIIKLYALLGENVTGEYVTNLIDASTRQFYFQTAYTEPVRDIKGYDYILKFNYNTQKLRKPNEAIHQLDKKEIRIELDHSLNRLLLLEKKDTLVNFILNPLLKKLIEKAKSQKEGMPNAEMQLIEEGKSYKAKLQFLQLKVAQRQNGQSRIQSFKAELMLHFKKPKPKFTNRF